MEIGRRRVEVRRLAVGGHPIEEIAATLGVSVRTVQKDLQEEASGRLVSEVGGADG